MKKIGFYLVVVILGFAVSLSGTRPALSQNKGKVVILSFEAVSKEDISFVKEAAPRLLASRLGEETGWDIQVVPGTDPAKEAAKGGATYVLTGSITKLGSSYSLDLILYNDKGQKTGGFFTTAENLNKIIEGLDGLAVKVAKSLKVKGEPPSPGTSKSPSKEILHPVKTPESVKKRGNVSLKEETHGGSSLMTSSDKEEGKRTFTNITYSGILGKLPGEIYRVAAADIDGDGYYEVAFMGSHKVYVYRFRGGKILRLATIERGKIHHFLNIDSVDVDGDGLPEFAVTDRTSDFLDSFLIGEKEGKIGITTESLHWYLSVFENVAGKRVLVGQGTGDQAPYNDRAYLLKWEGGTLKKSGRVRVPMNEGRVMGIINMNSFLAEGKQWYLLIDQYEKIRIVDTKGKIRWKSGDYFSGSFDYFLNEEEGLNDFGAYTRYYVHGRMKSIPGSYGTLFLTRKAPKPILSDRKSYSSSKLVLVTVHPEGVRKVLASDETANLITDFALIPDKEGYIILASVIEKSETGFSEGISNVTRFYLK